MSEQEFQRIVLERFSQMDNRFDQIDERFNRLEAKMDEKFEKVNGQLASLATNQVRIEKKLAKAIAKPLSNKSQGLGPQTLGVSARIK